MGPASVLGCFYISSTDVCNLHEFSTNQANTYTNAKSNYRGSAENQAVQKFYIHFFIDNSNADISLYALSCPNFYLGQHKVCKLMVYNSKLCHCKK